MGGGTKVRLAEGDEFQEAAGDVEGVEAEGYGKTIGDLGERRKLFKQHLGQSSSRNWIWWIFGAKFWLLVRKKFRNIECKILAIFI